MLVSVQYMRAVAALMVVVFHVCTNMYGSDRAAADSHIYILSGGVDLFFVISGFVMFYTTTGKSVSPAAFLKARLMRIAPLYWLMTASMLLLTMSLGKTMPTAGDIGCSIVFVPCQMSQGGVFPVFNPGWTLNYEMFFYAVFACALFIRQWQLRVAAVATLLFAMALLKPVIAPLGAAGQVYANGLVLEFVMGIGVGIAYRRWGSKLSMPWAFVGAGLLIGIAIMESSGFKPSRMVYAALPAALILLGLLALNAKLPRLPILGVIGDASYSIYLCHPIVLDLVDFWLPFTNHPSLVNAAVATAASVVVGIALYFAVEKRLTRILKPRRTTWSASAASTPVRA